MATDGGLGLPTAVFVDIHYMETASWGEVCQSIDGHLCQDWDHAERWRLRFDLNHPNVLITHVDMEEREVPRSTYESIRSVAREATVTDNRRWWVVGAAVWPGHSYEEASITRDNLAYRELWG